VAWGTEGKPKLTQAAACGLLLERGRCPAEASPRISMAPPVLTLRSAEVRLQV
jgi:hypothetical protein